ncbi:hypothetical protein GCM10018966_085340 [Streptomyces yanii]
MRRHMVAAAVAGEEGDPAAADLAEEEGVARLSVRGVHANLGDVLQEGVQARAADDTDLCVHHAITVAGRKNTGDPAEWIGGVPGEERLGTSAQAADVPLADDAEDDDEEEDEAEADEADDFESDPVEEDEAELDAFAGEDDGVLLDDDPRLSFR